MELLIGLAIGLIATLRILRGRRITLGGLVFFCGLVILGLSLAAARIIG